MAVLPVVLFHLGFSFVGGGFVGVDVFFVISGYLIGGIILGQIRAGNYSISRFYARRVRRLAPALVVTLIATTIAVLVLFLPLDTVDYGKSLLSTVVFASNFYFYTFEGYFGAQTEMKPLVHTWSLAVEEQYYVVFPLIMMALRRLSLRFIDLAIWAMAIVSAGLSVLLLRSHLNADFYLLPTRLWELLLGVIAVEASTAWLSRRVVRELVAVVGLALIAGAMLLYTSRTPFPGLGAMPPCLGAAMMLYSGAAGKTLTHRLLSWPPMIFFGLISYSLYLWHWPIIVMLKQYLVVDKLDVWWQLFALAVSVLLAWATWLLIERPWRNPAVSTRTLVVAGGAAAVVLAAAGALLVVTGGLPGRVSPEIRRVAAVAQDSKSNDLREGVCFLTPKNRLADFNTATCLNRSTTKPNVLLFGDSHAAHLWSGLKARQPGINVQQAAMSSCEPLAPGAATVTPRCAAMSHLILDGYLKDHPVDWIILSASWQAADAAAVGQTIDWLHQRGFKVVLAGPIIRYRSDLPWLVARSMQRHDLALVEQMQEPGAERLDATFRDVARAHGALYWSPYETLCPANHCRTLDDTGAPVQFDYGHLTASGSRIVADAFPAAQVK